MQTQTVFRAGNSQVVAIPKDLAKELGLTAGEKVVVEKANDGLLVRKAGEGKTSSLNADFKTWWNEFLEENSEILDELATR